MAVLTDEIKEFIVKGLAQFDTPSQVAEAVRVNFGIAVSRQQVHAYDPACSRPPAPRWIEIHAATRQAFLRAIAEIGVAQKAVRLRMLDRFAQRAEERNYLALAAGFLEQAAKECGGAYENRKSPLSQQGVPGIAAFAAPTPAPRAVSESAEQISVHGPAGFLVQEGLRR